jgi:hypothetical protein
MVVEPLHRVSDLRSNTRLALAEVSVGLHRGE